MTINSDSTPTYHLPSFILLFMRPVYSLKPVMELQSVSQRIDSYICNCLFFLMHAMQEWITAALLLCFQEEMKRLNSCIVSLFHMERSDIQFKVHFISYHLWMEVYIKMYSVFIFNVHCMISKKSFWLFLK